MIHHEFVMYATSRRFVARRTWVRPAAVTREKLVMFIPSETPPAGIGSSAASRIAWTCGRKEEAAEPHRSYIYIYIYIYIFKYTIIIYILHNKHIYHIYYTYALYIYQCSNISKVCARVNHRRADVSRRF